MIEAAQRTHTEQVTDWLPRFGAALEARRRRRAPRSCSTTTATGATWCRSPGTSPPPRATAAIARHARAHAGRRAAARLALEGEASEADGVIEGWFRFETGVARGRGHLRLKDGKAWTLLTTMTELKGFEERTGADARQGRRARRASRTARPGSSAAPRRRPSSASRTQPYCRDRRRRAGRHRARRAAAAARRADDHRREERAAGRLLAQALQDRCACTIRSGTTTCPTCRSPTTGRCSRPRTRSPTGSRCTRRSWSSTTGARPSARARATTRRGRSGRSRSCATASR